MAVLGAILGVIVGLVVGLFFTEWVFANNQSWPDVVPFVLAVLGGLAGWQLGRRFSAQRAERARSA